VIDQAYSNLLLAEDQFRQTKDSIADLEQQILMVNANYPPAFRDQIRRALKEALKGLQIKFTQDQLAYERSLARYNALLEPPDPVEVAAAEAELVTTKAQLKEAIREWERVKDGTSPAEIAVLEAKLKDAQREWERVKDGPDSDDIAVLEARIAAAQASLESIRITAPFDGTISAIDAQPGDQVSAGTLAFRIDDFSKLMIDVDISEIDINQIEVGQDVRLSFDSVFAKEYQGRVVETALVGTTSMGLVNFGVTVEISYPDANIKPGMTSEAYVVTSEIDDVLLVPSQAIRLVNGEKVVYVLDRGILDGQSPTQNALRIVPVTLGLSSNNISEILTGNLHPGDEVLVNPPEEIINPTRGIRIPVQTGN
jgi:HlyD family secretion protein